MKIRKKAQKTAKSGLPLYVVGFSFTAPSFDEVKVWFDLEYGGPLKYDPPPSPNQPAADLDHLTWAIHGPWRAAVQGPLPEATASEWRAQLAWGHRHLMCVRPTTGPPATRLDGVLHAARLARGLTLLSHGTAYDTITDQYLNPSDWQDRRLEDFSLDDHLAVVQAEGPEPSREWFYTDGLRKFGLDELETFRAVGLPAHPAQDMLRNAAEVVLHLGRSPGVESTLSVPLAPGALRVRRHRTVMLRGQSTAMREIIWVEE